MNRVLVGVAVAALGILALGATAQAGTVVRFNLDYTVSDPSGPINYFDVELMDNEAPITVANFLQYVNNGLYNNTLIHRDAKDFVVQGGGFTPTVSNGNVTGAAPIMPYAPIQNEYSPTRSNLRGTIAMAKLGGDPNSATSQWFVNLGDNSSNLDNQNGGFTVFGKILGSGMALFDGINQLQTYDLSQQASFGNAFSEVPMFNNGQSFVTVVSAAVLAPPVPKPTGSLSGAVYVDVNKNGLMDAADYALADAQVSIFAAGSNTPLATVTCGADGTYHFENLPIGTFTVKMTTPVADAGQNVNNGHMILDKDGTTIVGIGTIGAAGQNVYTNVALGDGQSGVNFNFAEGTYPVGLLSARLLLNTSEGVVHATPGAVLSTNAANAKLEIKTLVGNSNSAALTVSNIGGQGSALSGTFGVASGKFGLAGASAFGPLDAGQTASGSYTYAPTTRGTETQDVTLSTSLGDTTITLSGTAVAPVSSVTKTDVGYVLVGGTGTGTVTVKNVGDGNLSGLGDISNLQGSLGAGSGNFSGAGGSINLADNASQSFNYSFTPTTRGADSATVTATLTNGKPDGTNAAHTQDVTLSGTGVAPVQSVISTAASAGLVRIGSSGVASVQVKNIGNGNLSGAGDASNLKGTVAASDGLFLGSGGDVNLADGASQTYNFTYKPAGRGTDSTSVALSFLNGSADGKNLAESITATLSGQGVGPTYSSDSAPGSTLAFDPQGSVVSAVLNINNSSTDANGGNKALTNLTLLSADISGTNSDLFSLSGFTAGTVLEQGQSAALTVNYTGTTPGFATLKIGTDEGAALGGTGNVYEYSLVASVPAPGGQMTVSLTAVPEPGSLTLLAAGALSLGVLALRRRAAKGR